MNLFFSVRVEFTSLPSSDSGRRAFWFPILNQHHFLPHVFFVRYRLLPLFCQGWIFGIRTIWWCSESNWKILIGRDVEKCRFKTVRSWVMLLKFLVVKIAFRCSFDWLQCRVSSCIIYRPKILKMSYVGWCWFAEPTILVSSSKQRLR